MPVRRAIANGNWSNTATWFGGTLPTNGDTVVANGFNVTIDQDVTIGGANNPSVNAGSFVAGQWFQITFVGSTNFVSLGASANAVGIIFQYNGNTQTGTGVATALATLTTAAIASASAVAGGGFTISPPYILTAGIRAGTTTCVTLTGTGDANWTPSVIVSGPSANAYGLLNNATSGSVIISGAFINSGNGGSAYGILNASTATTSLTGCTIQADGNSGNSVGVANGSSGSIIISSSSIIATASSPATVVNFSTGSINISNSTITTPNSTRNGVQNSSTGSLSISGSTLTAGASTGIPVVNSSTGTCAITTSTFTASASAVAFNGTSTPVIVTIIQGSQFDNANGTVAVLCGRYRIGIVPSLMQYRKALDGTSTFVTLYTADFGVFGNPPIADVRSGVSYGGGGLTGTAAIPAAGSVALGVPVDATTGTAVLTAANVQTALTSYGASTLTKADVTQAVIPLV
jgi:hypothetical protein